MPKFAKTEGAEYRQKKADREYAVLDALCERSPIGTDDVAEGANMSAIQAHHALISLEVRKFVTCQMVDGHRQWSVTDDGRVYAITPIAG